MLPSPGKPVVRREAKADQGPNPLYYTGCQRACLGSVSGANGWWVKSPEWVGWWTNEEGQTLWPAPAYIRKPLARIG